MPLSSHDVSQEKAHGIEWISVPLLPRQQRAGVSARQLNRFLGFQQLLNEELLRHPSIVTNEVLERLESPDATRLLIPILLPQWALVVGQLMISRQQLMIDLMGDSPLARFAEQEAITVSRHIRYDGNANAQWHAPPNTPDPASLLLSLSDEVMGWWEACQSLLPELGVLMPDMAYSTVATNRLCRLVERDYNSDNLAESLSTMFIMENVLSNDVASRLQMAIKACGDDSLPAPGERFFNTFVRLARENSALVQHFIEAWFFSEEGPDEAGFLRQGMVLLRDYDGFWKQFLR